MNQDTPNPNAPDNAQNAGESRQDAPGTTNEAPAERPADQPPQAETAGGAGD